MYNHHVRVILAFHEGHVYIGLPYNDTVNLSMIVMSSVNAVKGHFYCLGVPVHQNLLGDCQINFQNVNSGYAISGRKGCYCFILFKYSQVSAE